jgi:RNA polymerase sigma-32 factor
MQLLTTSRFTYRHLTREIEADLIRRCQAGDSAAGGLLVQAHDPFIHEAVRQWFGRGLDKDDVMQAGREGYLEAIRRFDPSLGNRLNTYAKDWAWAYAQKAVAAEGSTIAVGRTVDNQIQEHRKAGHEIPERLQLRLLLRNTLSLSAPMGGDDMTLEDIVPAEEPLPEESAVDGDALTRMRRLLNRAMTCMSERERELACRRLLAEEPETLVAIGESWGVCRERARQVEAEVMRKLGRALRLVVAEDDAVLWGGDLPKGPMRRREPLHASAPRPRAKVAPRKPPEQTAAVRPLRPARKAVAEHG